MAADVATADAERKPDSGSKTPQDKPDGAAAAPAAPGGGLGGRQVQAKGAPGNAALGAVDERATAIASRLTGGDPLPVDAAMRLSGATGEDVSAVRVHRDDPTATSLGAAAYTSGDHVAFAPGAFEPDTPPGRRLLFHELAHVVQQRGGARLSGGIDGGREDPHEHTADRAADQLVGARPVTGLTRVAGSLPSIQRQQAEPSPHKAPAPIDAVWGGDRFTVSFAVEERNGEPALVVRPRYTGSLPFDAESLNDFSLTKTLGSRTVNATAELRAEGQITIDLYGDGDRVFTLVDAWATTEREIHEGRRHDFTLLLFGKPTAGRTGWVLDPKATPGEKAVPLAPPKPFSSAATPVFVGGISAVDVVLGPYRDTFRLTAMAQGSFTRRDEKVPVVFGISSLYKGRPSDAAAHGFTFTGVPNFTVLDSGTGGLTIDMNGDGTADLTITDAITVPASYDGGGPVETNRNHDVQVSGADFGVKDFAFTVRWGNTVRGGYANPRAIDNIALSNAQAVYGLGEQRTAGVRFEGLLDSYDFAMLSLGRQAAAEKVVDAPLVDAWAALIALMARVRLEQSTGSVPGDTLVAGAAAADTLYSLLEVATKDRMEFVAGSEASSSHANTFTGKLTTVTDGLFSSKVYESLGAAAGMSAALRRADVAKATVGYHAMVSGVARWVATRLGEAKGASSELAVRARAIAGRRTAMGELAPKNPRPVTAVFHPAEKFANEPGYVSEVQLMMLAWKDGDTWNLRDLTNPESTYDFSVKAPDFTLPPAALFAELDDIDHFPAGVVHWDMPDEKGASIYGGQVRVRDHLTWKKFFSWLGLGLAAIGLTLATFGTGTVAVAGAWVLAASALAGGASAAIDLADKASHNALTATTVILDVAQIVASIAGVGQLRYGLLLKEATGAAQAGVPWMGEQAIKALGAQQAYIAFTGVRVGADAVTLAVVGIDTIHQLQEIENSTAGRPEKDRAKLVLLTTLGINGGMFALQIKGELPKLGGERQLVLHYPVKGGPPVANVGGLEVPTGIKFSQKNVSGLTGDKTMTIEELADSMKAGWKGPGIDVVEMPDGTKISLDNRRLLAAQMAGLKELPVAYHPPNESFPVDRNPIDPKTGKAAFQLDKPIMKLADGTLVVGGTKGTELYGKGYRPKTYGEAAMIRSANQGAKFGVSGSFEQPAIRVSKAPQPPAGTE